MGFLPLPCLIRNKAQLMARLVGLFLILMGVAFVFFTYLSVKEDLWMKLHARKALGKMVEIKTFRTHGVPGGTGARQGRTRKAWVVFQDETGQERSFWSDGYVFIPYQVGETVIVLYDPTGEHRVRLAEDIKMGQPINIVFLLIGLILLRRSLHNLLRQIASGLYRKARKYTTFPLTLYSQKTDILLSQSKDKFLSGG